MTEHLSAHEIAAMGKQFLMPAYMRYWPDDPLVLRRGMGQYVFDANGRRYLDAFGAVVTISLGHCDLGVLEAQIAQMREAQHFTTLFPEEQLVLTAVRLAGIARGTLSQSFFTNSGSEANEVAAHLARRATRRTGLISLYHSFHGRTATAAALTAQKPWRNVPPYSSDVHHVPNPYLLRRPGMTEDEFLRWCLHQTEETIKHSLGGEGNFAGLWVEPIQGNGGVIKGPSWYYDELVRLTHKYGGLLIADEVQTGFGRTGKWFGCDHWGEQPDMMVMAKGMGNGYPVGGVIATPAVAAGFDGLTHFNTYGGNPVAMATVCAVIDGIDTDEVRNNIKQRGAQLMNDLEELYGHHRMIGEVRGQGLMIGVEIVVDRTDMVQNPVGLAKVHRKMRDRGFLLGKGGVDGNVFRIKPPYCITKEDCDDLMAALDDSLTEVEAT